MAIGDTLRAAAKNLLDVLTNPDYPQVTPRVIKPLFDVVADLVDRFAGGDEAGDVVVLDENGKLPTEFLITGDEAGDLILLGVGGKIATARLNTGSAAGNVVVLNENGKVPAELVEVSVPAPYTTTISTGAVAASDDVDLDFSLPAGVTKCFLGPIVVTRTAGDGTSFKLQAHTADDRSDDARHLFGNGASAQTIGATALAGPIRPLDGGHVVYGAMPYVNTDGSSFARLTFVNGDGVEGITCDVAVTITPLP